ncbi:MAG: hypothetical protein HY819_02255 [Acidobacteria bacterium]|nr:hypothetical protein [Acidobacteriota bacterium]
MNTSRKKVDNSQQSVQKKFTILGVLCGAVALILIYQYFAASNLPPVKEPVTTEDKYKNRIPASQLTANNATNTKEPSNLQQAVDQTIPNQLDLKALENKANGSANGLRNPFEYPPPPPPPPLPPPKPATIRINTISPTSVFAKTKTFDVVIRGTNLTDDMMIYLGGNPSFSKTIFVNDTEVRANVPANYFANPGQLQFQLKKRGQEADEFSNTLAIRVDTPKDPSAIFKMVGQFTDNKGQICAVLAENDAAKPTQIIRVKDIVAPFVKSADDTNWEVISINKNQIELKDIKQAIGVTWPVKMKSEQLNATNTASNNANNAVQNYYEQAQFYENGNTYVDPNGTVNLTDALQNQNANNGVLGQTPEDIERSKQIQQQNFKMMNELMQKQREAILRQQEQFRKQQQENQQPIIRNQPQRR